MDQTKKPTHFVLEHLQYCDNTLIWGSRKVSEIAEAAGQTPFYAYDSQRMTQRVAALREAMPAKLHIHYAMKANPMPEVVQHFVGLVDGLDVASAGELDIALETGLEPANISFAGPGKRDAELATAIASGITVNLESENEMRRLADLANQVGRRPDVAIRVNPDFELKNSGMKMGGRASPFGIDAERVPSVIREIGNLDINLRGFHVFAGSQNLRESAIGESMSKSVELILKVATTSDIKVDMVNLGGGLGIPYFPKEGPLDLSIVGEYANEAIERLQRELGGPEVIMELGRFLVGESGIYVCKVLDVKVSQGKHFAICDGGLHHHLAASGNFGQILRKNYPVANVERRLDQPALFTVVGPLCTPLDLLADNIHLDTLTEGSLVAVFQSGAYGLSASPRDFLSHPKCVELFI